MSADTVQFTEQIVQTLRTMFIQKEDLTLPVFLRIEQPRVEEKVFNFALSHVRQSLGQRTILRLGFEVLTRYRGKSVYRRLRKRAVYISCPTPEQAELAIEAILSFAASLDGKWLAPAETPQSSQATDSAMLREHSVNPVNETSESAEDPRAISKRLASEQEPAGGDAAKVQEQQGFSGS